MEHVHNWVVKPHSPGVGKGACLCGAARYYPTCFDKEYEEAARELNRKEAKKEVVAQKEEVATVAGEPELPPVPPRPSPWSKKAAKDYYHANREQILAEIKYYGTAETARRWGIASGTMTGLKRRWGQVIESRQPRVKSSRRQVLKTFPGDRAGSPVKPSKENVQLALPPWNDNWVPEVQVKWLDVFKALSLADAENK